MVSFLSHPGTTQDRKEAKFFRPSELAIPAVFSFLPRPLKSVKSLNHLPNGSETSVTVFSGKSCAKAFPLHLIAKPLFPARLDKKCHCDMGPQKFTYCPLRLISDFTFFRYISNLQRYILQKAFISTFPQPETHIRRLFHRAGALPLHGFSPLFDL